MLTVPLISGTLAVRHIVRRILARRKMRRLEARCYSGAVGAMANKEGALVKVQGFVSRPAGFISATGRTKVVLASYLVSSRGLIDRAHTVAPSRELYGIDFWLLLDDGDEIGVRVGHMMGLNAPKLERQVVMHDRPVLVRPSSEDRTLGNFIHDEVTIAVGDRVEVIGTIHCRVEQGAEAAYRGSRLGIAISGSDAAPVVVRRVVHEARELLPGGDKALPDPALQTDEHLGRSSPSDVRR